MEDLRVKEKKFGLRQEKYMKVNGIKDWGMALENGLWIMINQINVLKINSKKLGKKSFCKKISLDDFKIIISKGMESILQNIKFKMRKKFKRIIKTRKMIEIHKLIKYRL